MISPAAVPILASPAANIGLAHSAPPEGLTVTASSRPSAPRSRILLVGERRVQLGHAGARRPGRPRRPLPPTATVVRSRAPSEAESIRCSNPVIQAGRAHSSRARAAEARITAAAPSPTGAQSWARSGSAT